MAQPKNPKSYMDKTAILSGTGDAGRQTVTRTRLWVAKNRHLTRRVQQRAVSELCKAPMGWVLSPRRDPRWPRVRMVRIGHGIEKSFLGESRKCSARLESPRLEQIFTVQLSV